MNHDFSTAKPVSTCGQTVGRTFRSIRIKASIIPWIILANTLATGAETMAVSAAETVSEVIWGADFNLEVWPVKYYFSRYLVFLVRR